MAGLEYLFVVELQRRNEQLDRLFADPDAMQDAFIRGRRRAGRSMVPPERPPSS